MSKHTPGPWHIRKRMAGAGPRLTAIEPDSGGIAIIHHVVGGNEANAHLIAAAPELLKFVQDWLDGGVTHAEAKALVAKAEGA